MTGAWDYRSAFVLQLDPGTDPRAGQLGGRIEHVASTRSARFGSLDEFLRALETLLAEVPGPDGEPGRES